MKKKKLPLFLFCAGYLSAILVMDFPFLMRCVNAKNASDTVNNYRSGVEAYDRTGDLWEKAREYNEMLSTGYKPVEDAFGQNWKGYGDDYNSQLRISAGDDVMCIIRIPEIDVELPVYHGCTQDVLQKGAGHLPGSSLPAGGASTHCCIGAHRGLEDKTLFTDVNYLKKGDRVYLDVLDRTLIYEVTGKETVMPDDMKSLRIRPGEDLLTLVTCTPYGQNTHRLYIHCKREGSIVSMAQDLTAPISRSKTVRDWWKIATIVLLCMMALQIFIYLKPGNKKNIQPAKGGNGVSGSS